MFQVSNFTYFLVVWCFLRFLVHTLSITSNRSVFICQCFVEGFTVYYKIVVNFETSGPALDLANDTTLGHLFSEDATHPIHDLLPLWWIKICAYIVLICFNSKFDNAQKFSDSSEDEAKFTKPQVVQPIKSNLAFSAHKDACLTNRKA